MRFDKWWRGIDLKDFHGLDDQVRLDVLAEYVWEVAFDLGEMTNNEAAYDDGYNQGHHDGLAEIDIEALIEEAFTKGHSRGHAEGMKDSIRELL